MENHSLPAGGASEWQYTKPKSQTLKRAALIFIQSIAFLITY